ncbi:MAG: LysM peptidoglycan-binding domain-containing protein, partial [Clostridia bacterium]|nr:LysM peptidoglycan-binding domain-containing protein [Clostridia bacterium]
EIAKYYGTTVSAIISANDLDDESEIACDRLIMIPFVK